MSELQTASSPDSGPGQALTAMAGRAVRVRRLEWTTRPPRIGSHAYVAASLIGEYIVTTCNDAVYLNNRIVKGYEGKAGAQSHYDQTILSALEPAWEQVKAGAKEIEALKAAAREKAMEYLALDQQATEAVARAVKAEEERDRLAEFTRNLIREAWDGCEGCNEIQDHAQRLGLIVEEPGGYDPDKHGNSCEAEPGEPWFVFADWLDDPLIAKEESDA